MKIFAGAFLIVALSFAEGISQQAELSGLAPQFAGGQLPVMKISNPITGKSETIDTLFFDSAGNFNTSLPLAEATWIFLNSGIFRVVMYIEPGRGYEISLPPNIAKTEADIRNPFFKPITAHIQVSKEYSISDPANSICFDDINSKIFRFDTALYSRNQEMLEAIRNQRLYNSDSLISILEQGYDADTSLYFRKYRRYRYGVIKINSRDVGLHYLHKTYLYSDTPEISNPAYMELFSEMFTEFIFYFSRTDEGRKIGSIVNQQQDRDALVESLKQHLAVPDNRFAELIILKEIFDIYSKDYFRRESLLTILDTIIADPATEAHSQIAFEIKKQITRLKIGEKPPDFQLIDENNTVRQLSSFNGKYVYLNFCTPDNYSCLKEFPFLKALHTTHNKYLQIVTIMVTENIDQMKDFMKKNNYGWTALFYGNDDVILSEYDVRAYPTCFLLDREGKLIQSPATLATEGFEMQLFKIMRSRGDL